MLTGINLKQRVEFSSANDTSEPKTVFVLRPLTADILTAIGQHVINGQLNLNGNVIVDLFIAGVEEVRSFSLGGTVIESEKSTAVLRDIAQSLDVGVLGEIIHAINEMNHLGKEEAKNS